MEKNNSDEAEGGQEQQPQLQEQQQPLDCAICLEQIDVAIKTPCGHPFCLSCLDGWIATKTNCGWIINLTCPLCIRTFPSGESSNLIHF